jgi:hypothetical protein
VGGDGYRQIPLFPDHPDGLTGSPNLARTPSKLTQIMAGPAIRMPYQLRIFSRFVVLTNTKLSAT